MSKLLLTTLLLCLSFSAFSDVVQKEIYNRTQNSSGILVSGYEEDFQIASHILGITPPASWPGLSKNCTTIECALAKQFKDERSARLVMEIARAYEIYISIDQSKNEGSETKVWTYDEILLVKEVLDEMPKLFFRMSNFKYFYRNGGHLGRHGNVPAVAYPLHNGYILLADAAFGAPSDVEAAESEHEWRKITILHEICHQYDFRGKLDHKKRKNFSEKQEFGFYQFSWLKTKRDITTQTRYTENVDGKLCQIANIKEDIILCPEDLGYIAPDKLGSFNLFTHRREAKYNDEGDLVSWYANDSVAEDFAESCAHYRYAPEALKKIETLPILNKEIHGGKGHKNRYEFLKNIIFNGVEY